MPVSTAPPAIHRPGVQIPELQPVSPLPGEPPEGGGDDDGDGAGCGCGSLLKLASLARAALGGIGLHAAWQAFDWADVQPMGSVVCGLLALLAWGCMLRGR